MQLYINDIFIFYNLKITETKQAQQQPYEQCLREYLNKLYNTANFEDFVQLACLRIYDNSRFITNESLKCFSNGQALPQAAVGLKDENQAATAATAAAASAAQSEEANIQARRNELERRNTDRKSPYKNLEALTNAQQYTQAVMNSQGLEEAAAYLMNESFSNEEERINIFKDVLYVFNPGEYKKVTPYKISKI